MANSKGRRPVMLGTENTIELEKAYDDYTLICIHKHLPRVSFGLFLVHFALEGYRQWKKKDG